MSGKLSRETTSWFAIALDEIRTRRILREKADCKQSISPVPRSPLGTPGTMADHMGMDPRKKKRPALLESSSASSTNKYPNFSDPKMFAYYYSGTFRTKINCLNESLASWRPTCTRLCLPTSSPGRFSLALCPTSKAREKRPGDEVVCLHTIGYFRIAPSLCFKRRLRCEAIDIKITCYSHANKIDFYKKRFVSY